MSDNKSFVLRGIKDTAFEPRPVPEGETLPIPIFLQLVDVTVSQVSRDDVLVEVKKTGIRSLCYLDLCLSMFFQEFVDRMCVHVVLFPRSDQFVSELQVHYLVNGRIAHFVVEKPMVTFSYLLCL